MKFYTAVEMNEPDYSHKYNIFKKMHIAEECKEHDSICTKLKTIQIKQCIV